MNAGAATAGVILALLLFCVLTGIGGLIIMLVWNVLAPLLGAGAITYWQGVAVSVVLKIIRSLFK